MPSPRPSPAPSRSPPLHAPVAASFVDGTVTTQCRCSKLRNRRSCFSSAKAPALRVLLGRERIDLALTVHAHRRHPGKRRVEGARLTAGGIAGVIDARGPDCWRLRASAGRWRLRGHVSRRRQRTDNHQGRQHCAHGRKGVHGAHYRGLRYPARASLSLTCPLAGPTFARTDRRMQAWPCCSC